jgi:hypothetical protein
MPMAFDQNDIWQRTHVWKGDRALGIYADAARFDEEGDDIAAALTSLKQSISTIALGSFDAAKYYDRNTLDAKFNSKQDKLAYTPASVGLAGQSGGWAPLGADRKIPAEYLPATVAGGSTSGVGSFQGRTGAVSLLDADVEGALGYTPANVAHGHAVSQITGLQGALDNKQDVLPFVPAPASHGHAITDIANLQAALNAKLPTPLAPVALVTTSSNALETTYEVGAIVMVDNGGSTPAKNAVVNVYPGYTSTDSYNLVAGTQTKLVGTWRCRGSSGTITLAQKVTAS